MEIKDKYSYGNLMMKTETVFDNYNSYMRQEVTKTQDIDYVMKEMQVLNEEGKAVKIRSSKDIRHCFK